MDPATRKAFTHLMVPLMLALSVPTVRADSRHARDLEGEKVNEALGDLTDRGYSRTGTEEEHGSTLHYLWNPRSGDCAVLAARDGRVRSFQPVSSSACKGMGHRDANDAGSHGDRKAHEKAPLPREVTGLVGNKRDDAEDKLASLGFRKLESDKSQGRTAGLWWDRSRGECLNVESTDGRVRSIQREPRSSCD